MSATRNLLFKGMEKFATSAHDDDTGADRQDRLDWEAEGIAKARASVAAGYFATSAEVKRWIESLGSDNPLPIPYPTSPRPR